MNETSHQRAMSEDERAFLQKLLRDAPLRWKSGLGNAIGNRMDAAASCINGGTSVACTGS